MLELAAKLAQHQFTGRKEGFGMSIQILFIRITLSVKIALARPRWMKRKKNISSKIRKR